MSEYDVYGIGNALVDMEYSVEPGICGPWASTRA
jgi:hypothetical protein